jgi:hypothetical protein
MIDSNDRSVNQLERMPAVCPNSDSLGVLSVHHGSPFAHSAELHRFAYEFAGRSFNWPQFLLLFVIRLVDNGLPVSLVMALPFACLDSFISDSFDPSCERCQTEGLAAKNGRIKSLKAFHVELYSTNFLWNVQ